MQQRRRISPPSLRVGFCLEVARLGEGLPSRGIGHGEGVSSNRMGRTVSAGLGREQVIRARGQRLPRIESEGIGHGGTRAAVALRDLSPNRVVFSTEAHSSGPLHHDRDGECG